jgi:hypothetical protein
MSLLRLVIAWLVMAALPLQGIAAASMLFCGGAAHSASAAPHGHDHAAHSGHGALPVAATDAGQAEPVGLAASLDHSHHVAEGGTAPGASADDAHACPICASCCNLVALSGTPAPALVDDAPAAHTLDGPLRVLTRHTPTPDKPPRA